MNRFLGFLLLSVMSLWVGCSGTSSNNLSAQNSTMTGDQAKRLMYCLGKHYAPISKHAVIDLDLLESSNFNSCLNSTSKSKMLVAKTFFASAGVAISLGAPFTPEQIAVIDPLLLKALNNRQSGKADEGYQKFLGSVAAAMTITGAQNEPAVTMIKCAGELSSSGGSCSSSSCSAAPKFCNAIVQLAATGAGSVTTITNILNGVNESAGLPASSTPSNGDTGSVIIFDPNGGTGTMPNESVPLNQSVSISPNAFTRLNSAFVGWSTTSGGSAQYADGATITPSAQTTTLYAVWQSLLVKYDYSTSPINVQNQVNLGYDDGVNHGVTPGTVKSVQCASFDGTSSYISLPDNLLLNINSNFTIELRFATNQFGGILLGFQEFTVDSGLNPGTFIPLLYTDTNGYLLADLWTNDGDVGVSTSYSVADGFFHTARVVAATDATTNLTTVTLYVDDLLVGASLATAPLNPAGLIHNQIGTGFTGGRGGLDGGSWNYFNGCIQSLSIYEAPPAINYYSNEGSGLVTSQPVNIGDLVQLNQNTLHMHLTPPYG
ncbi:MAG: InlB B-repeat-containing protein [Myxococcaceae bacterium]